MASKTFAIRTEPHEAKIGDAVLLFRPEVIGSEFAGEYARLRESQTAFKDGEEPDLETIRAATAATREFIASFLIPESAAVFNRWDVVQDGQTIASYRTEAEAEGAATEVPGAAVVFSGLNFPDRVLVEIINWVGELYGAGPAARPTGRSSAPSRSSKTTGTGGSAASPSLG